MDKVGKIGHQQHRGRGSTNEVKGGGGGQIIVFVSLTPIDIWGVVAGTIVFLVRRLVLYRDCPPMLAQ